MWAYLIIGVCSFVVMQFAIGTVAFVRFLPSLFALVRYLARLLLVCSFWLYRAVLQWVAPYIRKVFKVDLVMGQARLAASIGLSVIIGIGGLTLLSIEIAIWMIALAVVHGLLVGLLWDDLSQTGELRMGVKL